VASENENKPKSARTNIVTSAPSLNSEVKTESSISNNQKPYNKRPRRSYYNKTKVSSKRFSFKKVSIVVPLYNEEESLKELFPKKIWSEINPILVRFGKTHTSKIKKNDLLDKIKKIR